MERILVLVSLSRHIGLLEQFAHYYLGLAADAFLVHINDAVGDGAIVEQAKAVMAELPCTITDVWTGPYDCYRKTHHDARALEQYTSEDDWVLVPDLDEFQEYPAPLSELLRQCEQRGCNAVRGEIIDRLAPHGALPQLDPNRCVFSQFPYQAQVTGSILQALTGVLTAIQGIIPENRHFTDDESPTMNGARQQVWPTHVIDIHHFKWSRNAIERMRSRYRWYKARHDAGSKDFDFYEEGKRLLDYLERRGGRFDTSDPVLQARLDGRCLCARHPPRVTCTCKGTAPGPQRREPSAGK